MFDFHYSPYAIPNFIVAFYVLFLGIFVLIKSEKRTILHYTLFGFCVTIFIWLFNYGLCYLSDNEKQALFWARNTYIGIVFICVFTHHFFISYMKLNEKHKFAIRLSYVLGFSYLILSRTELFFKHAYKYFWGYYPKGYTWLYTTFIVFFFGFFMRTFYLTLKELRRYKKYNLDGYTTLKTMFIAICILHLGSIDYIAKYGIEFYPAGYIFPMIWLHMLAYTIIKYRAFDIQTVIHKTFLWLVMSASIVIPLAGIVYIGEPYLKTLNVVQIVGVITVLLTILILYYNKIQPIIDNMFQRKKYDYRLTMDNFLEDISIVNNIDNLNKLIHDVLNSTLYPEKIGFYLLKEDQMLSEIVTNVDKEITFEINNEIIQWFEKDHDPIEKDVLILDPKFKDVSDNFVSVFNNLNATILVPIIHNKKIISLLGLGKKKNLKPYSQLDIDFIKGLSIGFGIAIANSLMFETVQQLNIDLEGKVEERTAELQDANEEMKTINDTLIKTNDKLEEAQRHAKIDMDMAANVQTTLFSGEAPKTGNWDIALTFNPMSGVSGDMYDFYTDNDRLEGVVLFDVSGHGVASGLITMIARSVFYRKFNKDREDTLNYILEQSNKDLINEMGNVENYLTGIMLRFKEKSIEYVNAGHSDLIIKKADSGKVGFVNNKEGDIKGRLLGMEGFEAPYKVLNFNIDNDDFLILYTDCIYEGKNTSGEQYGLERLKVSIKDSPDGSARDMMDYILNGFNNFIGDNHPGDDMTIIILKRTI